ncbi:hypothetical protein FisN_3Lh225 [Fistulifera solaris]|uniref:Major facilitator superfamily (MFS) profile domain-containing protein n=1 Tax=Fistulifera solaris TaxID=1519565 RepID=A0A1Z5JPM2_FISSO|nr:hypothetical protein FisN_3Lh225 [Fistulifera solaris]|eukprot:GAX15782.1 hypothetical protein FisN_3Lh225 [Fistulifera solaris]
MSLKASIGSSSPFRLASNNNTRLAVNAPTQISSSSFSEQKYQHLYVLPVLLLEFLAIALTRAILPGLLLQKYGDSVYLVMGCTECVRGLLAFLACPFFGKLSDVIGRKVCLFVTVLGTCAPVCVLAFFSWDTQQQQTEESNMSTSTDDNFWSSLLDPAANEVAMSAFHPNAVTVFVILLALSGIFSSTFTLVFAYISDTVHRQDERVSAYGLALATFGLSFTMGPIVGGYLAQQNKQYVFLTSLLLTVVDLAYIYFILPESRSIDVPSSAASTISLMTLDHNFSSSWKPWDSLRLIATDPFLRKVGEVAFLYYIGLWAIISTLSVYAVKRFHLTPERLGELMSALGLSTMLAEAVLVRFMVPWLGEKKAMKVGLVSFGLQCVVLGFATEGWHLFVCAMFSLLGNLVYPSLSSLVSGSVEPDAVGEALGAINGIKALTEGIGPLVFGSLMTLSEASPLPGWPYLLASLLVFAAYRVADELPDLEEDDYIHELERKQKGGFELFALGRHRQNDDEVEGLLSEIDEYSDHEETSTL